MKIQSNKPQPAPAPPAPTKAASTTTTPRTSSTTNTNTSTTAPSSTSSNSYSTTRENLGSMHNLGSNLIQSFLVKQGNDTTRSAATATAAAATGTAATASNSTTAPQLPAPPLQRGAQSSDVRDLQNHLVQTGHLTQADMNTGPGIFGPRTEAAVRSYQRANNLPATGIYDQSTAQAMGQTAPTPPAEPTPSTTVAPAAPLERGSHGEDVRALQQSLVDTGYLTQADMNSGPGNFGPRTEGGVRRFQRAHNLPVTGIYDQPTAQALEQRLIQGPSFTPPPPPINESLPTSTQQANQSFLTQWGPTAYNDPAGSRDIPYGYSDCGPTSALMALNTLGLTQQPTPETAHSAIDAMRDSMYGHDTTTSNTMGFATVKNGLTAYGAQGIDLPVTRDPVEALSNIDNALQQGMPVILGTNKVWDAWGAEQKANGNYLNSRDPGGHFVTVLGRTPEGNYIVGDPLVKGGSIEVSPAQMEVALGAGSWGMVAVAPANNP